MAVPQMLKNRLRRIWAGIGTALNGRAGTRPALTLACLLAGASLAAAAPLPSRTFRECPDCPDLVVIPGGTFVMGSPANEPGRYDSEGPQHRVTVRAFALGRHDVTVREFQRFLEDTGYQPAPCDTLLGLSWKSPGRGLAYPPGAADSPDQPAVCVGWDDIQAYLAWLNRKVGHGAPYRLPSEAEWEYAARAGTTTSRWWGEAVGKGNANCNGCGSRWDDFLFAPVDTFGPNPFGLYDMLGNVWQWTADCWHETYAGAPADGRPWTTPGCRRHVLRGGSWSNLPIFIRSAARVAAPAHGEQSDYSNDSGFRLARTIR